MISSVKVCELIFDISYLKSRIVWNLLFKVRVSCYRQLAGGFIFSFSAYNYIVLYPIIHLFRRTTSRPWEFIPKNFQSLNSVLTETWNAGTNLEVLCSKRTAIFIMEVVVCQVYNQKLCFLFSRRMLRTKHYWCIYYEEYHIHALATNNRIFLKPLLRKEVSINVKRILNCYKNNKHGCFQ